MNKLHIIKYDGAAGLVHFCREHNSKAYHVTMASWIRFFGIYSKYMARNEIHFSDDGWNWTWPIGEHLCPSCYGAGVLHADGHSPIGCFRCDGSGEITDG